jgi:uncharacterized membrane protein YqgA involved in biofilm formation
MNMLLTILSILLGGLIGYKIAIQEEKNKKEQRINKFNQLINNHHAKTKSQKDFTVYLS